MNTLESDVFNFIATHCIELTGFHIWECDTICNQYSFDAVMTILQKCTKLTWINLIANPVWTNEQTVQMFMLPLPSLESITFRRGRVNLSDAQNLIESHPKITYAKCDLIENEDEDVLDFVFHRSRLNIMQEAFGY
jgi:hypothetical protein